MRSKNHRKIPNCYLIKSNKIKLAVARLTLRNGHLACLLLTKHDIPHPVTDENRYHNESHVFVNLFGPH